MTDKNKGTILWNVPDEEIIDFTARHEDRKGHLYKDHLGNVTVGYGHMIPNRQKIRDIDFYDLDSQSGGYATDSRRQQAFDQILKSPYGRNIGANYYVPNKNNGLINLTLKEQEARKILIDDLREAARGIRSTFHDFDNYNDYAQRALLDMQFNMGGGKFQRKVYENGKWRDGWPNLFDAVEAQDWQKAAKEAHRKDVSNERNKNIYDFFIESKKSKF